MADNLLPLPPFPAVDEIVARFTAPNVGKSTLEEAAALLREARESLITKLGSEKDVAERFSRWQMPTRHPPFATSWCACLADDNRRLQPWERAALLAVSAVRFWVKLDKGEFPQERNARGEPLEMAGYGRLFGSMRPSSRDHVLVMVRGRPFIVWFNSFAVDVESMALALSKVIKLSSGRESAAFGLISSSSIREWDELKRGLPRRLMPWAELIDTARFVINLDVTAAPSSGSMLATHLHSGVPENRWYFRPMQFVVDSRAGAALVGAVDGGAEGTVASRFASEVAESAQTTDVTGRNEDLQVAEAPAELQDAVARNVPRLETWRSAFDPHCGLVSSLSFNATRVREMCLSPDALFHLVLYAAATSRSPETAAVSQRMHVNHRHFRNGMFVLASPVTQRMADFARRLVGPTSLISSSCVKDLELICEAHRALVQAHRRSSSSVKALMFLLESSDLAVSKELQPVVERLLSLQAKVDLSLLASSVSFGRHLTAIGRFGFCWPDSRVITLHYTIGAARTEIVWLASSDSCIELHRISTAFADLMPRIQRAMFGT